MWSDNVSKLQSQVAQDIATIEQLKKRLVASEMEAVEPIRNTEYSRPNTGSQGDGGVSAAIESLEQKFCRISVLIEEACQELAELKSKMREIQQVQISNSVSSSLQSVKAEPSLQERSSLAAELAGLEGQFEMLLSEDAYLEALKAEFLGKKSTLSPQFRMSIDAELEDLKQQIDKI